jgi:hypothetical protein
MKHLQIIAYITFFILLLLFSCKKKNTETSTNIAAENGFKYEVVVDEFKDEVVFEDIVKDYKYIKLETNDECILDDIKKMLFYEDKIYILAGQVYCFDMNGNFLFALDKQGHGPGEYIRIDEMNINNDILYIYDNYSWKIFSFDIDSGSFLASYKLPYSIAKAVVIGDNLFADRRQFNNEFLKGNERVFISNINKPEKINYSFFPEKRFEISSKNQFYESNGQVFFSDPYFNKVYKLHSEFIENWYSVNCNNNNLTELEVANLVNNKRISTEEIRERGRAHFLEGVFESEDFIISQITLENTIVTLLFDKNTKNHIAYQNVKFSSFQIPPQEISAVYGDYFCKVLPAYIPDMNNQIYKKQMIYPQAGDVNQEIYYGIQAEDNPVIVMFRFNSIIQKR